VNAATCKLTGLKPEDFLGKTMAEVFPADLAGSAAEHDRAVRESDQSMEFIEVVPAPDGAQHEWMVFKFPVRDSAGTLLVGGMGIDVDARRKLEAQLRQSQKMEAVGRLAGGVAHDFNNMLTVINGYSELLMYRTDLDTPVKLALHEIVEAGERAAGLTRQLLAFSRQQVVKQERLMLGEIVSRVDKMLRRLIGEDIELRIRSDENLLPIMADAGQMEQVMMNLALNARDAMPSGGRLAVETRNQSAGEFAGWVCLTVMDNGDGMSDETLNHLFEPFYTTKTEGKGTGLGLATVYGIVEGCGGHIRVHSKRLQGTRFDIFLPPASAPAGPAAISEVSDSDPERGSETILLVEDEHQVRRVTRTVLEEIGYTVVEAVDGADALHRLRSHEGHVDLLLTDVVMPRMSGWELSLQVRDLQPDIKILFMSGYTDDARLRHGVNTSTASLIEKPFKRESLARKVREVLQEETHSAGRRSR
jgi:two-component system cell cycle sensor histidine kinase/response regulator CckA